MNDWLRPCKWNLFLNEWRVGFEPRWNSDHLSKKKEDRNMQWKALLRQRWTVKNIHGPWAWGLIYPIKRPTCHITIVLKDMSVNSMRKRRNIINLNSGQLFEILVNTRYDLKITWSRSASETMWDKLHRWEREFPYCWYKVYPFNHMHSFV